jgi:hypothetical protein
LVGARDVEAGIAGGKGDTRGIKWKNSAFAASDSGVGAVNTRTSELRARHPVGFSDLSLELLRVRLLLFFVTVREVDRDLAREVSASVVRPTEKRVAFMYAD